MRFLVSDVCVSLEARTHAVGLMGLGSKFQGFWVRVLRVDKKFSVNQSYLNVLTRLK